MTGIARGLAANEIRCPGCNAIRQVAVRHARRWREGGFAGLCNHCRAGYRGRAARDCDIAYWLKLYGVDVPRGTKARDHITASGLPPELARFAQDAFPPEPSVRTT